MRFGVTFRGAAARSLVVAALAAGLLSIGAAQPARAQSLRTSAAPAPDPPIELEPYVGIARHSPAGVHLGDTPDRSHLFLGLHITATVARWRRLTIGYAPEVAVVVLSNNPWTWDVATTQTGTEHLELVGGVRPVAGIALSPVGFEARLAVRPRWRVYSAVAAGFIEFTRATPEPLARAFNYTFEIGAGAEYRVRANWWIRAGYKFHHLSNAFSAYANPGVDGNVWMVGVGRAFGGR